MNTRGSIQLIPIFLTAITLATALFFFKQRVVLQQKTQELLQKANQKMAKKLPEPTPFVPVKDYKFTITPSPTTTIAPKLTPAISPTPITTKGGTVVAKNDKLTATVTSNNETICTPVYGMANSCAEHSVVDTALDTSVFYNLAGMSYLFGLAAFIKSKRK